MVDGVGTERMQFNSSATNTAMSFSFPFGEGLYTYGNDTGLPLQFTGEVDSTKRSFP